MKRNIFNAIQVYLYSTLHNKCRSTDNIASTPMTKIQLHLILKKCHRFIYLLSVCLSVCPPAKKRYYFFLICY